MMMHRQNQGVAFQNHQYQNYQDESQVLNDMFVLRL